MGTINPSLPSDGTTIDAADVNTPFNSILGEFNGNIDNDNIKSAANIAGSKLADASISGSKLDATLAGGWLPLGDVPDTVTYNGNGSYDLVFNSNDLTDTVSAGMRLRTTRTVSAPTQCTSLNGTTQYWVKSSPNKLTFTDDFVATAYIKLTSYASAGIISRFNGTSGWQLGLNGSGQLFLVGYNGGSSNFSQVLSYQSVPLNKWVRVTGQLDMSAFTATSTTSYLMIDDVDVPAAVSRGGTNPTALVQAGSLMVGAINSTTPANFFPGKIAQAAVFSAKVTQATMKGYTGQTFSGSETSLASAYSFNNSTSDLNTTTPNDLSAGAGSPTATEADSPFGTQASGSISATLDYGIVTKASFSTNTTLTVQVPEGCTIPTSGGVSAVSYSTQKAPYGMPIDAGRWKLSSLLKTASATTSNATMGSFLSGGWSLTVPVGAWEFGWVSGFFSNVTTGIYFNVSKTSLTGLSASAALAVSPYGIQWVNNAANSLAIGGHSVRGYENLTSASTFTMYTLGATTSAQISGSESLCEIYANFAYL